MKRVFLAVSFHNNSFLEHYVSSVQSKLQNEKISWIDSKKLHLTFKFFGPTDDSTLENIKNTLDELLKKQFKLQVSFEQLRIFGSKYQPRVLWMAMKNPEPITKLEIVVRNSMEEIGIQYDRQNFVPHLTIGRIKQLSSKKYFQSVVDKYKDFDSGVIQVDSIYLYQSIIRADGPIYKVIKEFKLK
ncbi:MAG: RNA 2',3'-cyclic phosphodiesterase [Bacteroidetes bacterium]|nr:MAG: RNA 2',3'-cyclic phosphodiesterase [Bacteroidota bacterium]